MDEKWVRDRITALRMQKGVSEYKMSYDLGHSKSYMQAISSGRALPSMTEFLYMCEYFGISPAEFFSENNQKPYLLHCLFETASALTEKDQILLLQLAERMRGGSGGG